MPSSDHQVVSFSSESRGGLFIPTAQGGIFKIQSTKSVWFEKKVLGHNTLENMLKNMSQRAGFQPYFTKHSLRTTTVTVLSSVNLETTQQIKAVTGHKSDASIESYCERLSLDQFQHMSTALSSFIHGKENTPPSRTASSSGSESKEGAMA